MVGRASLTHALTASRTCSTFGQPCVGLDSYPNATISDYGSIRGKAWTVRWGGQLRSYVEAKNKPVPLSLSMVPSILRCAMMRLIEITCSCQRLPWWRRSTTVAPSPVASMPCHCWSTPAELPKDGVCCQTMWSLWSDGAPIPLKALGGWCSMHPGASTFYILQQPNLSTIEDLEVWNEKRSMKIRSMMSIKFLEIPSSFGMKSEPP